MNRDISAVISNILSQRCTTIASDDNPSCTIFLSASDGATRARVLHASGVSPDAAWQKLQEKISKSKSADQLLQSRWLRIDWIETIEAITWKRLSERLQQTKRNYFRHGIALDASLERAFLEQELNGNAMLYGGNAVSHAIVNENNILLYARQKYGAAETVNFADDQTIFVFTTGGVFIDENRHVHDLTGPGRNTGRRSLDNLTPDIVRSVVESSSRYLARQVQADGTFIYGYHPCFNRTINAYNVLRHASTTYAMTEAWEVTGDDDLKAAIERSLNALTHQFIKTVVLPDGDEAAFLVDVGDEIKLGGNAVCILAMAKYTAVTGDTRYQAVLDKLARGIAHMQDPQTGAFTHVLNYPSLSVKQAFRTIYYEGEAAFALMRLYGLSGDSRWLEVVERAFDNFIAQEHWKHHDHWLSYCVNELTKYKEDERYFRFGLDNISGYLDFIRTRITTFPTLLELSMAAQQMLMRINETPRLRHLLSDIDLAKFREALDCRAAYLLNGYFWPEIAMYFRSPETILGSFFIRHHAFRVRIDDVEHYLSGLIAYGNFLADRQAFDLLVDSYGAEPDAKPQAVPTEAVRSMPAVPANPDEPVPVWTAADAEAATGGTWVNHPPAGWSATGLSTFAPAMQPGNLVVVRAGDEKVGMLPQVVRRMRPLPAGIITADPQQIQIPDIPVLQVASGGEAVLAMGRYARARAAGKVLAVTGSAGKTTVVSMLAHALSAWGDVGRSAHNANLPHGVSWNLASIPAETPYIVLELAIGRMGVSARLARPHVAIFTNVLPAHLGASSTVKDIARTKSAIFLGVEPGGTAVINRDMMEWETVYAAAQARQLNVLHYGTGDDSDFRLIDYDPGQQWVTASVEGREISYRIGAAGRHMALNSLAILAAVSALGHSLEAAIAQLETFSALPGRGEEVQLLFCGRHLTIIDDSYNANPGSMKAALDRLNDQKVQGRKIAVLGQMADLGPHAADYHTQLAPVIDGSLIDRVYVTGELYESFWQSLGANRKGDYVPSLDALKSVLMNELVDGDLVLFKGSNSTKIHEIVAWIKEGGQSA